MALVLHREWGWRGWISADRTWISASEHDFLSRIPCPLHTATRHSNHGVPKASFTVHQLVCSNDVTVTSRSFVRWPEQRYTRAGGSVDFVREIVFPCPKETFSRPAAIRYATTIPVVLTPCSLLHRERTNFLSLWIPIDEISEASSIDAKFVLSYDRTIIIVWDAESLGFIMMRYHPIPAPSYNRIIRNINLPNRKAWSVQNYNRVAVLKPKLKVTEMITGSIVVSFYYIHRVSTMRKVKYLFKIFNDPPSDFFHASVIVQEARAWTGLPREYKRRAVAKREESKHVTVQQDRGSALYGPVN